MRRLVSSLILTVLLAISALGFGAGTAAAQTPEFKVLVFSKTAGFRHDSIPAGIAAVQELGAANNFEVDATEDAAAFNDANLAQYDAVIWLSTTGDVLDDAQQAAFERYVQGGGGYAGIHAASDTEYTWAWYGGLVGAYFDSHPANQTATVKVADHVHPSTEPLPERWTRFDEWYNFQTNPRGDVHVLATLDETTYSGGNMGFDHPTAWCHDYDGGRAWYTGGGHTSESFSEPLFRQHMLGGIRWAAGVAPGDCGGTVWANYAKVTLDDNTSDPFELKIAADGRVFFIERGGAVKIFEPSTQQTALAGQLSVYTGQEDGLLGLALDPSFATNGWIYLYYARPGSVPCGPANQGASTCGENVLSRFTVDGNTLEPSSEQVLLEIETQRQECCHAGGSLDFDGDGNLYVSTGDNTNPFASDGYTPIDERAGRSAWDAQRTSANTNDLRGKLLRIHPEADGTYTVPAGNLFAPGTAQTRPEIYGMGFRNPFRFDVDPETGWAFLADYGPDAGSPDPDRGPAGHVEWNVIKESGNYGWPYCVGPNFAYHDYDFSTGQSGPEFDCAAPVNGSPNNTGLTQLPAAEQAQVWYSYGVSTEFPELGSGCACPMAGPVYHYDASSGSETKFPEYFDDTPFFYEWGRNYVKEFRLDSSGELLKINDHVPNFEFLRPMDMEFGPDGSMYLLEWGTGFGGANPDSGLYRIDYVKGSRSPIAEASADPDSGPVPLTVQFSSEGSRDPDPGDTITFAWDFEFDGTVDSTEPHPTHTYTAAGNYTAQLTVTDTSGKTGVANVLISAGNTRPTVTIEAPVDGGFFEFGDQVAYDVSVTDPEDAAIDCSQVVVQPALGHDEHAHPLEQYTGCSGVIQTQKDEGHGDEADLFYVIEATYTDEGAPDVDPLTGRDLHVLQPKRKQAEHYSDQNGIVVETTGDVEGGGQNIGFIAHGDWVSFEPMNLLNIDSVTYRWASAGWGGRIEVHVDSPDGPMISDTGYVAPTGGWQTYKNVTAPISDPGGTHELFFVFYNNPGNDGLFNINWIDFNGKGVSLNAAPSVTASADPTQGTAPLAVEFSAEATDPEGQAVTYEWDFGDGQTGSGQNVTHTYQNPGTYTAKVTATDEGGASGTDTVEIKVNQPPDLGGCPGVRSDEFDGTELDRERWTTIVRESQGGFSVGDGVLTLDASNGDIYGGSTGAGDFILQPLPDASWQATTKVTFDPSTNYQQAGLLVYGDDDNYAKLDLLWAGARRIEFIREANGSPRNEAGDSIGVPAGFPTTFYLRIASDGTTLTAAYSADGTSFTSVGRPAALAGISNPHVGVFSLKGNSTAPDIQAQFDWFRFSPDAPLEPLDTPDDEFDGNALDRCRWNAIVREDASAYRVTNGALEIDTQPGDVYGTGNSGPKNLVLQTPDHAPADYVLETKLDATIDQGFQQAGFFVYTDDDNYVKFNVIADQGAGRINRIELRSEVGGIVQNPQPNANVAAANDDGPFWLRLTKTGTTYTGEYSFDGQTWTAMGATVENTANVSPMFGLQAMGVNQAESRVVAFDYFLVDGRDDVTPPTTTATLNPAEPDGENGWYVSPVTVTLEADDGNGSGVASTEYRLDGGDWTPYTEPFIVSADGEHTVDYRSTDEAGNAEEAKSVSFKIDATAPTLTCSATPNRLWPPNHKLVTIAVAVELTDATSGPGGFELASVTSDEPDAGTGPEDVPNDIQGWSVGTPDTSGTLRAERADGGDGRVYTITYTGKDQAGNTTTCNTTVTVPKTPRG
ncbi:MAG: ThuA domain-containing protein [Gaiellaceae bacterium]